MSTTLTPQPNDDDVTRGLSALETYAQPIAPAAAMALVTAEVTESLKVRDLRAAVAEDAQLRDLYTARIALDVDTPRVRTRRLRAQEAAKLHALGHDPAVRALEAAQVLKSVTISGLIALVLALGWSTAYVHTFAAAGAPAWSGEWVMGWFVEPFISLALLTIVAARSYLATRGRLIRDPKLVFIEYLFLALSLGMNVYPTLAWGIGPAAVFVLPDLVLHCLGPIVAVAIVTALPILWAEFARLNHGFPTGLTAPEYSGNTDSQTSHVRELHARAMAAVDAGALTGNPPSAASIRRHLKCGTDQARQVRDLFDQ